MKNLSRRVAAIAVVGAVVIGGISLAQAANADQITGTIQLHGPMINVTTQGPVITSGSLSDGPAFYGLTVNQGCPAGFRGRSDTVAYQNGVKLDALSTGRNASTTLYGNTGLDGNPISMDDTYSVPGSNPFVSNKSFDSFANPLVSGAWEIRLYCSAVSNTINYTTDKFFVLAMTADTTAGTWAVASSTPVVVAPTVSLTAATQGDKSIKLTATVKNGTNVATDAAGSVKFFDSSNALVGTGTVAAGVASFTTAVKPVGTYSYTAQYIHTGSTYADSAVSGSASASVSSNVAPVNITVTIPAGQGSLTLTGVATSVDLGTAVLDGGVLKATGTLPAVTVTDTRQLDAAAWSLTGITTDFTAGAKVLDGKYLGWAPFTNDSVTNAGTIGAAVAPAPATANGLKTVATLASGSPVDQKTTTKVGAQLNLAAPASTPAGAYSATLTLTLV